MEQGLIGWSGAAAAVASAVFFALHLGRRNKDRRSYALTATVFAALAGLLGVMWWLHRAEPSVSRVETLKTGGLASASIVALYALWLNDRRRRVEEDRRDIEEQRRAIESDRQQLETRKADHDRQRVGNEQFSKAIELLGHAADQVRVGALHALAAQAEAEPARVQTVLDVLCSYLRRPFDHEDYRKGEKSAADDEDEPEAPSPRDREDTDTEERERQVRLTAQRLIAQVLRSAPRSQAPDLDLTGARLDEFALSECTIGELVLTRAKVFRSLVLTEVSLERANLDEARIRFGELNLRSVEIAGDLDLLLLSASLMLRMEDVNIGGDLILGGAELNWGGILRNVDLSGEFDCRAWLGRGLQFSGFTHRSDKPMQLEDGLKVLRGADDRITDIYDPEVLAEHNLPDPETSPRDWAEPPQAQQ
ncbi:hypothetical protein AB0J55_10665 [Amycolatopsis sp. NPDC049688]|uniref:hypothetical protein n=1 Tax=Amycolatopsis sp. NPDC049688 TaxID=3154733 RepID=UPI00342C8420